MQSALDRHPQFLLEVAWNRPGPVSAPMADSGNKLHHHCQVHGVDSGRELFYFHDVWIQVS